MAKYKKHYSDLLIIENLINGGTKQIPKINDNYAYLEYLEWLKTPGNLPDEADSPPPLDPVAEADTQMLRDMADVYQEILDGFNAIQASHTQLSGEANTLSTITVGNIGQVQTTLRKLGTTLGIMIDNTDKLARGNEKMLKALAALKRRTGQ